MMSTEAIEDALSSCSYEPVSEEALMGLSNPKPVKSRVLTCLQCKKEFDSQAKLSDAALSLCSVCNLHYMDGIQQSKHSIDTSKGFEWLLVALTVILLIFSCYYFFI